VNPGPEQIICIDWGTTNFRAYLVDTLSGNCLSECHSEQGLLSLKPSQFAEYCQAQVGHWRVEAGTPIYLSGMVGSDKGWASAPQLDVPVSSQSLARELLVAPGMENAWIVPGAKIVSEHHVDVMRGEEVQILGAMALHGVGRQVCCLPGTHSKWASADSHSISHFSTSISGELYSLLLNHSLLGRPAQADAAFSENAFRLGVGRSSSDEGLLHALFEARSRFLYAGLTAAEIPSFISGVVIGEEVGRMRTVYPRLNSLLLVCSKVLFQPYSIALKINDIQSTWIDSEAATLAGMLQLHRLRLS
jgi:2-dehydro-3-deoxygalactonokinase